MPRTILDADPAAASDEGAESGSRPRGAEHHLATARRKLAARAIEDEELAEIIGHLDRGARLLECELVEAQRQLALHEKLAALGLMATGVAHEIKNPLNFVNNFAELSLDRAAELRDELTGALPVETEPRVREVVDELTQNVAKIREHGARAEGIVRGMLDDARIRAGKPREIDLNALVRAYTHAAMESAPDSRASVTLSLDEGAGKVRVVAEEIGRVVLNLVANAIHAAEAQRAARGEGFVPEVRVSTRARGDRVEVRVRDNGAGIPAVVRDRIYTPFFTTKPEGQGTGLGLSLSRDIVSRHHGEIDFESEEGDHTEFVVTLPRG
jgi:signal transduction histidine kinase